MGVYLIVWDTKMQITVNQFFIQIDVQNFIGISLIHIGRFGRKIERKKMNQQLTLGCGGVLPNSENFVFFCGVLVSLHCLIV